MLRFRLRFLLQEFDLVGPEAVIGRSPECSITIEDPLISRRHACIKLVSERASIEDLGSRNGVRVNGRLIKGPQALEDGDRIRIGTQELVFAIVHGEARSPRPTGYMRVCAACNTVYPEGAARCPHCGAPTQPDEETMAGGIAEPSHSWTFQLFGEVVERALQSDRTGQAERLMSRAAIELDERLAAGERLDPGQMSMIAQFAVRLTTVSRGSAWISWVLDLHRRQSLMLSDGVIERLEELDLEEIVEAKNLLRAYVGWVREKPEVVNARGQAGRIERLERLLGSH